MADPSLPLVRELSLVNYHIECTENRLAEKFKDPLASQEYTLLSTHIAYTGARN